MAVVFPDYIPDTFKTPPAPARVRQAIAPDTADIGQRFEQMLWTEMLSHAGLEKAVTQSGGEGAAAFSRYMVEAIAKDIAEAHPLGLAANASPKPAKDK